MEYKLADSKEANDLATRLESLRVCWENLWPGFHKWFVSNGKVIFQKSVIDVQERIPMSMAMWCYYNSIECQHYLEKKEQYFRKGIVEDVMKRFKSLEERQQDEEVRAIYWSGPYRLSDHYKRFEVDSVKWHSMDPEVQMKHVERFQRYRPTLDDQFHQPKSSGRKPSDRNRIRKPDFKSVLTGWTKGKRRAENRLPSRIPKPRKRYRMSYFFRSIVPRSGRHLRMGVTIYKTFIDGCDCLEYIYE